MECIDQAHVFPILEAKIPYDLNYNHCSFYPNLLRIKKDKLPLVVF